MIPASKMKCSVGVAISAVIVLILSGLTLLAAGGMVFMYLGPVSRDLFDSTNLPPGANLETMRTFGILGTVMLAACASLGVATGIGLIRLWRWSRYSIIVFGGMLIFFGIASALVFLLVPIPTVNVNSGGNALSFMRIFMSVFYGLWVALGLFFVLFFVRKKTAAQFRGEGVADGPPRRPISITIIACLMLFGGVTLLIMAVFGRLPAMFAGVVLTGVAGKVFNGVLGAAYLLIGIGLLKLSPAAYWAAVAAHIVGLLNVLLLALPSTWQRYDAAMNTVSPSFTTDQMPPGMMTFVIVSSAVGTCIPLYFLITRRKRYMEGSFAAKRSDEG